MLISFIPLSLFVFWPELLDQFGLPKLCFLNLIAFLMAVSFLSNLNGIRFPLKGMWALWFGAIVASIFSVTNSHSLIKTLSLDVIAFTAFVYGVNASEKQKLIALCVMAATPLLLPLLYFIPWEPIPVREVFKDRWILKSMGTEQHLVMAVLPSIAASATLFLGVLHSAKKYRLWLGLLCMTVFSSFINFGDTLIGAIALLSTLGIAFLVLATWASERKIILVSLVAMAALAAPLLIWSIRGELPKRFMDRVDLTADSVRMVQESNYLGVGRGNFHIHFPGYTRTTVYPNEATDHAHNEYIEVMAETGLFGLVAFLILMGAILRNLSIEYIPGIVGFLLVAFFYFPFSVPTAAVGFWALAGMGQK